MTAATRSCPLCGGRSGRRIWSEDGFHYLRCTVCRLVFSDLSGETYDSVRHNVWDEDDASAEVLGFYGDARRQVHDAFLSREQPAGRLLDVGCGMGFFLERAASVGWDVLGCEPSRPWAAAASERVGKERALHGTAEHPSLTGSRFDLITVWDVLEHIFDPMPFLARLRDLLAPGGRLFIRTPNLAYFWPVYGLRRALLHHAVELGPTNHVVYFTGRTLRRALEAVGLRPYDWRNLPPPQVSISESRGLGVLGDRRLSLAAKNGYAQLASRLAARTDGRIVISADLDVMSSAA